MDSFRLEALVAMKHRIQEYVRIKHRQPTRTEILHMSEQADPNGALTEEDYAFLDESTTKKGGQFDRP
jgi:hypothetical protein